MGYCPSACGSPALMPLPTGGCNPPAPRYAKPAYLFMYTCDTEIPDPIECNTIKPLFDDGSIVISPKLANLVWDDPTTEDKVLNDCDPALQFVTGRVLNGEDRNAISQSIGSPAVVNPYYDMTFWKDKVNSSTRIRWGVANCNGDGWFLRDSITGNPAAASFRMWKAFEKSQTQGAPSLEIKKFTLTFATDPLELAAPDFNLVECEIELP